MIIILDNYDGDKGKLLTFPLKNATLKYTKFDVYEKQRKNCRQEKIGRKKNRLESLNLVKRLS